MVQNQHRCSIFFLFFSHLVVDLLARQQYACVYVIESTTEIFGWTAYIPKILCIRHVLENTPVSHCCRNSENFSVRLFSSFIQTRVERTAGPCRNRGSYKDRKTKILDHVHELFPRTIRTIRRRVERPFLLVSVSFVFHPTNTSDKIPIDEFLFHCVSYVPGPRASRFTAPYWYYARGLVNLRPLSSSCHFGSKIDIDRLKRSDKRSD